MDAPAIGANPVAACPLPRPPLLQLFRYRSERLREADLRTSPLSQIARAIGLHGTRARPAQPLEPRGMNLAERQQGPPQKILEIVFEIRRRFCSIPPRPREGSREAQRRTSEVTGAQAKPSQTQVAVSELDQPPKRRPEAIGPERADRAGSQSPFGEESRQRGTQARETCRGLGGTRGKQSPKR